MRSLCADRRRLRADNRPHQLGRRDVLAVRRCAGYCGAAAPPIVRDPGLRVRRPPHRPTVAVNASPVAFSCGRGATQASSASEHLLTRAPTAPEPRSGGRPLTGLSGAPRSPSWPWPPDCQTPVGTSPASQGSSSP
jgi:hypothetical protein